MTTLPELLTKRPFFYEWGDSERKAELNCPETRCGGLAVSSTEIMEYNSYARLRKDTVEAFGNRRWYSRQFVA